ncbi:MAG: asparaginase [Candidatus Sericytochromatia bacterium]|nr:asparaginase [Candidatus Sericytochromatia bacterium]
MNPVPDGLNGAAPLAGVWRSGELESLHCGHLVVLDSSGSPVLTRGNPDALIWVRSALKPVQALPLWLTGARESLRLSDAACAIAMASHSGQTCHVAAVREILTRAELSEEQLGCGQHLPYHEATANALIRDGQSPSPVHCNCSGKHAAMLAVCRQMGWDLQSYRAPEHPLQIKIRALASQFSGIPETHIFSGIDGCGAPVWRMSIRGLAQIFSQFMRPHRLPNDLQNAVTEARNIFLGHPLLIAGEKRIDTSLMCAAPGKMMAKIGGEAVHAGGILSSGHAWAMKVSDGNKRAIGPTLRRALQEVGFDWPTHDTGDETTQPRLINNRGEHIGDIVAAW